MLNEICIVFSDTKKEQKSYFDSMHIKSDHITLANVHTYVDWRTPGIELTGADVDGDIIFNKNGLVYFEAVDRIEITRNGTTSVIFERTVT